MAYQIKKNKNITENLELLDDNDNVAITIHVDINPSIIAKDFHRVQLELIHAQKAANEQSNDALEQFGNAVISMFDLVFGEEDTSVILEYFDSNYMEMALQVMPFISGVIQPALVKYANSRKAVIANNYDLSRRQKRKLGL